MPVKCFSASSTGFSGLAKNQPRVGLTDAALGDAEVVFARLIFGQVERALGYIARRFSLRRFRLADQQFPAGDGVLHSLGAIFCM
jgi:hypothetical protein